MESVHEGFKAFERSGDSMGLFEASLASLSHVQALVEGLYQILQSQFGNAGSLLDEVDFEVTFMTKSYKDEQITIYAYENRDHRSPRSLVLRAKNPAIYDATVTAEVYRQVRPDMLITEDTGKEAYSEVYPGQRERIRSAIVFPVLSDENALLGTIVVHCNKPGLFKRADAKFWRKLLEVYAKRIAYEKLCLDQFCRLDLGRWVCGVKIANVLPPN
jgi:hypothetical protein